MPGRGPVGDLVDRAGRTDPPPRCPGHVRLPGLPRGQGTNGQAASSVDDEVAVVVGADQHPDLAAGLAEPGARVVEAQDLLVGQAMRRAAPYAPYWDIPFPWPSPSPEMVTVAEPLTGQRRSSAEAGAADTTPTSEDEMARLMTVRRSPSM